MSRSRRSPPFSQTMIRQLPPGISPPLIITYSASSVPVLQLGLKGQGLSEQELFDFGANLVRNQLATVPGAAIPWPYGGKQRQVSVNVDIPALQAKGTVAGRRDQRHRRAKSGAALRHGQAGLDRIQRGDERLDRHHRRAERLADQDRAMARRSTCATSPTSATAFRRRSTSCAWTGSAACCWPFTRRATLPPSTCVSQVYAKLPQIKTLLPPQMVITPLFDQSIFVRAAVQGVFAKAWSPPA